MCKRPAKTRFRDFHHAGGDIAARIIDERVPCATACWGRKRLAQAACYGPRQFRWPGNTWRLFSLPPPSVGCQSDQSVRPHQPCLTLVLTESSGSAMVQLEPGGYSPGSWPARRSCGLTNTASTTSVGGGSIVKSRCPAFSKMAALRSLRFHRGPD